MKQVIPLVLVLLGFLCLGRPAQAQHKVSGQVTTATDNTPLAGVTISVKGKATGAATDATGHYSLTVPSGNVVLVFSFIGFIGQEVPVNDRTTINVNLADDVQQLQQVVAIGYGTAKKSDLTGSVATVSPEKLTDRAPVNAVDALQGRVAGMEVLNNSAAPGAGSRVRIRGINSINTGKDPLVVLDGIIGIDLNMINPNDIASVEVLKDASATAIYGARGANGVILVTTKRGVSNQSQLTYDGFVSLSTRQRSVPSLNSKEFMEIYNRAIDNAEKYDPAGFAAGAYPRITPESRPKLFDGSGNPLYNTSWEDEVYRPAVSTNHALAYRGGNASTRYSLSLGYTGENGIMISSTNERYNGKVTLDSDVKPWLTIGGSLMGIRNKQHVVDDGNGGLNVPRLVAEAIPLIPVKYPDGSWSKNNDFYASAEGDNPVRVARERGADRTTSQFYGDVYLNFKFSKELEFRTQFSTILHNYKNNFYSGRDLRNVSADQRGVADITMLSRTYWQSENYLTWKKDIGDHAITGMVGASWNKERTEDLNVHGENFLDDFFQWKNIAAANNIPKNNIYGNLYGFQLNSYFTRWSYGYRSKYLLTLTGRYDGSSKFGANNKYAFFPSAGVAWRVSEEPFLKRSTVINNLKLRASIGLTGNQEIASYTSLQFLSTSNVLFADGLNTGLYRSSFGNPDLKWETTRQVDIGVELGLLEDRIHFELDLYHKRTSDLLLNAPLPWSTGLETVMRNIGSVENKGIEIALRTENIQRKNFSWITNLNFASNSNSIKQLGLNNADIYPGPWFLGQTNILRVGHPIGTIWGYRRLGTWGTDEAAEAAKYGLLPGDLKWADLNKDGKINSDDETVIGQMYPKWVGNMNNEFKIHDFDISFDLRFSYGNQNVNATKHSAEDRQTLANSWATVLDAWRPDHQDTKIAEVRPWGTYYSTHMDDWWVEDASFIRLQNLAIGYTLPANAVRRLGLERCRVYVSAQNLFVITDYKNYDPEVETYGFTHAQGLDFYSYAKPRVFNLGLSVAF